MEAQRVLMPGGLRYATYACFGALWLGGCVWLVLHYCFQTPSEFGLAPLPLEGRMLWLHGLLAVPATYLLGWLMARHSAEAWRRQRRRLSGSLLTSIIVLLTISGFAMFFLSDERWSDRSGSLHQALGLAMTLFAAEHWWLKRRS
jgi:hypothetical protein